MSNMNKATKSITFSTIKWEITQMWMRQDTGDSVWSSGKYTVPASNTCTITKLNTWKLQEKPYAFTQPLYATNNIATFSVDAMCYVKLHIH